MKISIMIIITLKNSNKFSNIENAQNNNLKSLNKNKF